MCGDCTKPEDVRKLLEGVRIDSLVTDPPYGVDYATKNKLFNELYGNERNVKQIEHDSISDYYNFYYCFLDNVKPYMNDYNTCYIFIHGKELHNLRLAFEDAGYYWSDYLAWVKNNHVLNRKDYSAMMEHILYGWCGKHKFYGGFRINVLNYKRTYKNDLHPTMKPIDLLEQLVTDGCERGGNVLDCFGVSGSTLIACENTGRNCFMMECDGDYCDVIRDRYFDVCAQEKLV